MIFSRERALGAVPYFAAAAFIIFALVSPFSAARIGFTEDTGFTAIVVKSIAEGENVLAGPPSHTGGRHLGPIGYWHVFIPYYLTGGDLRLTFLLVALMELAAMLWICGLAAEICGKKNSAAVLAAGFLCVAGTKFFWMLFYPWHAHFLVVTSAFFVWATRRACLGLPHSLGYLALSASLAIQLHYSSLPLVSAGCLAALWQFSKDRRWRNVGPFDFVLCAAALVSWIPIALYEWRFPGTIAQTLFHHGGGEAPKAGLPAAFFATFDFFKHFTMGMDVVPPFLETLRKAAVYTLALLLSFFGLRALASSKEKLFLVSLAGAVALHAAVLSRLKPPLYASYSYPLLAVPIIGAVLAVSQALDDVKSGKNIVLRAGAGVFLAVWGLLLTRQALDHFDDENFNPPYHSLAGVQEIAGLIREDAGGAPVMLGLSASAAFIRAPLVYYMGSRYNSTVQYWNWIRELAQPPAPESDVLYSVTCPRFTGLARQESEERLSGAGWSKERELDAAAREFSGACSIARYRRRSG